MPDSTRGLTAVLSRAGRAGHTCPLANSEEHQPWGAIRTHKQRFILDMKIP